MTVRNSVALSKTRKERSKTVIPEPDQAMYGVMGPQYANYLATTAADQGLGASASLAASNAMALRNNYDRDQQSYANMLKRAQDLQATAQHNDIQGNLAETALEKMPEYSEKGIGALLMGQFGNAPGGYGLFDNAGGVNSTYNLVNRGDRRVANKAEADRIESLSRGIAATAPYGIVPKEGVTETWFRNPEAEPTEANPDLSYDHIAPMQENTIYGTDQGLTAEQQLAKAAMGDDGSGGKRKIKLNFGADGTVPTATVDVGSPAEAVQLRREALVAGLNPNKMVPMTPEEAKAFAPEVALARKALGLDGNPKAGAQSGAAPANSAAGSTKQNTRPARSVTIDLNAGQNDNTAKFWDKKKITSREGTRNDPFTGRPKEHHGTDYGGYKRGDVIPAEGDGVVVAVENPSQTGGYGNRVKIRYTNGEVKSYAHNDRNLVQVGDNVKRGSSIGTVGSTGRSTGPHVHVRVEKPGVNPEQVYANRLSGAANVDKVEIAGDQTVAHMKDGTTRVYKRGKRIG